MKKTISMYWPLAVVGLLAALACLHTINGAARTSQTRLGADQVTAELARAVSYGIVDAGTTSPVKPVRVNALMPAAEAS